jgi:hypothetical protein
MPPQSTYEYYLNLLGRWPTNLALASQWFLYFKDLQGVNVLNSNLQAVLGNLEQTGSWQFDPSVTSYLIQNGLQYNGLVGCSWARQVTLPKESIDIKHEGLDYGGYQPPATANTRHKYDNLSITMLETNTSFIDLILRPWAIAASYYGLVARNPNSPFYVKCNELDVVMLAKTGWGSPMGIRKVYTFKNVVPVTVPSEEYSYLEEGLRTSPIEFAYDSYSVSDAQTGSLLPVL